MDGEGCFPEEVRSATQSVMNEEMIGCKYRAVILSICASFPLVTSSSSLVSWNPAWVVVIHSV